MAVTWRGHPSYAERTTPIVTDRVLIESSGGLPAGISYADLRKFLPRGEAQIQVAVDWTYNESMGQDLAVEVTVEDVILTLPAGQGITGATVWVRNASANPAGTIFIRREDYQNPGTYVTKSLESGRRGMYRKATTGQWWVSYQNEDPPEGGENSVYVRLAAGIGPMAAATVGSITEETAPDPGDMVLGWVGTALRKLNIANFGRALRSTDAGNALTGNVKFWSGTAAAYAAIGTKDPNTIYLVDE